MVVTTKERVDVGPERIVDNAQVEISSSQKEQLTESIFCRRAYKSTQEFQAAITRNEHILQRARAMSEEHVVWESLINLGIAWASHRFTKAGNYFQEASTLARNFQAPATFAYSLNQLGNWLTEAERPLEGIRLHQHALTLYQDVKDQHGIAMALFGLGNAFAALGRVNQAALYYRQGSVSFRAVNDRVGLILTLSMRSACGTQYWSHITRGASQDLAQRVLEGEEALFSAQEIGWRSGEALAFINLGLALSFSGQYGRALKDVHSGLQIATEIEYPDWQTLANLVLGAILLDLLSLDRGALPLVWRFHVQLRQINRQQRKYRQCDRHYVEARRLVDRLANTISDSDLRENFLCRAGGMITGPSEMRGDRRAFGGLTKREYEVSTLIALRQSNQEMADQLGVGKHYVEKHFASILAKLGLNSRAQVAAWVMNRQLANSSKRR